MTTKKEEREALDMIRKILANLDSDGYLNTAFEGCLEIAQSNIDNDFACSLMQRVESLEEQVEDLKAVAHKNFEDLCIAEANAKTAAEQAADEIGRLREELAKAKAKQIPTEIYTKIYAAVIDRESTAIEDNRTAADQMAYFADTPADIAFRDAVEAYRKTKYVIADCSRILSELDRISPYNQ